MTKIPCVSTMFWFRLFVTIMSLFCPCSGDDGFLHAYSPGDIIIGGLFPIHLNTNRTTTPGPVSCSDYDFRMFLHTQVMIYAIREINRYTPGVLPNITIGYDIYDTCGDVTLAIRATLQLLVGQSDPQSCLLPENIQSALPEPKTKVVIGERNSEVSTAVARVVSLASVTQISYAATSELLSKKMKFPTFLRTISSDEYQTKAIAELVKQFNWKTVAIVASDDEYGMYGGYRLKENFIEMKDICIEFIDTLPNYFSQNTSKTHKKLDELVSKIRKSSAEAIIMFTKDVNVDVIMEKAIQCNLNRTWIASDAWSTSSKISAMPGIEMAGQVYGFISKRNEVPGFKDYVMSMFNGTTNDILEHYLTHYSCANQSEENSENNCLLTNSQQGSKQCLDPNCLPHYIDHDESYNIYLAVQVIVEGLRRLLKCDNQQCQQSAKFTALELLTEIRKVNFTVNTTHIFFDPNGDPRFGYDIVYWNMTESTRRTHIKTIGEYWPDGKIQVPDDLVEKMSKVTVSAYNCSKTCEPGQELKRQNDQCCYQCVQCANGDFSLGGREECKRCRKNQYSSPKNNECFNKTVEFLDWSDTFIIFLSSFEVLGIIITIVFAILFTVYCSTPIVKAVGGYLCFLELFSLLACFCLTFNFIGKPTKASCMLGLPFFGIAFSLCISCILANLLQILVGFNFDLKIGSWLKKLNQPLAVVVIVSGIQLALCVPWLYFHPPIPGNQTLSKSILLQCQKGSTGFFVAMLGYNALLAVICFLFAFKGKQLPDLYKNASLITISMLLFLVIWIIFIPIYLNLIGKYKQAIESAAILISSYSILGCHLAPKCYIMVFKKEINNQNAITEYIRKHYEQKGITVVKS
ncbi:G-protein coupled receptor family C group 6 member A-like [Thunnus albacares]|uniref:G-protein coupled receptor family C group 6 member A-like n=1 Tax=Thunnus albacares TaxID=8236 RepID=UPI001CF60A43|nr:G-protein coupled receptor family C group 6 member A-like [Thunnus albacares]